MPVHAPIPTEQIGSMPRPPELVEAFEQFERGLTQEETLRRIAREATIETIKALEQLGCSCISDGEQSKVNSFAGYALYGAPWIEPDGIEIPFADGHSRRLPRLTTGPFRYLRGADTFLAEALEHTTVPVKQAVISPAVLSLMYPTDGIPNYPRRQFIADLLAEHVREVRRCLELGAHKVQIDFTEARLSLKIDPSGEMLRGMVDLINRGLDQFSEQERQRIGLHTCPGMDRKSSHSADIDYRYVLPTLFDARVGSFYVAMAGETDRESAYRLIRSSIRPGQRVFVGVINPADPRVESPVEVKERVLQAARFIPLTALGTTDDCGFSPFVDGANTTQSVALAKIRARVEGTRLAEAEIYGS